MNTKRKNKTKKRKQKISLSALIKVFTNLGKISTIEVSNNIKHSYWIVINFNDGYVGSFHYNYKENFISRESENIAKVIKRLFELTKESQLSQEEEEENLFSEDAYRAEKGEDFNEDWPIRKGFSGTQI